MGMDLKEDDYIEHLFVASTHDYVLFFTNVGKVYRLKVHELPLGSRQSKGRAIVRTCSRSARTSRCAPSSRRATSRSPKYLVFATKNGIVKKTELAGVQHAAQGRRDHRDQDAREDDELVGVRHSTGEDDILMVSRKGQAIRFHEKEARPMGRDTAGRQGHAAARGRRGDLGRRSRATTPTCSSSPRTATASGRARRLPAQGPRRPGREDRPADRGAGQLAGARVVRDGYQVMLISTGGTVIRMPVDDVKRLGRSTQGVIVMRLREGEQVSALAPVVEADEDDAGDAGRRAGDPAAEPATADAAPILEAAVSRAETLPKSRFRAYNSQARGVARPRPREDVHGDQRDK